MLHHEVQALQLMMLATPRHPAQRMRDQAADGVEALVFEPDAEGLGHALDRRVAADAPGAVGQREDVALVLLDVELVLDLADDLLEHVLDRDQSGDAAELVDHDGQVVAVGAELAQQVVEPLLSGTKVAGRSSARSFSSGPAAA